MKREQARARERLAGISRDKEGHVRDKEGPGDIERY